MAKYSQKDIQQIYEQLPEKLQEALFSQESARAIKEVCDNLGLEEEKISKVSEYTGYVMLGIITPEEMEKDLTEEAGLKKITAKKIRIGITKKIFMPIKETLETLLNTKITLPKEPAKKKEKKPERKKDSYREPIN
mgnify:CR=1 FL=1